MKGESGDDEAAYCERTIYKLRELTEDKEVGDEVEDAEGDGVGDGVGEDWGGEAEGAEL